MYKFPKTKNFFSTEVIDGVKFVWVKNIRYKNSHGIFRMLNWFIFSFLLIFYRAEQRFDTVICSSPSIISFISSFILKLFNGSQKLILEIRDIWPLTVIELGKKSKYNPAMIFFRIIEKFAYKNADVIIGTMAKLDVHIKNTVNTDFKFKYIPQGIDLEFLQKSENFNIDTLQKFPLKSKLVIGYAGSMAVSNSLETLISASKILDKSNPEINFYFIGDGKDKNKLINETKSQNNVYFFEKVNKEYVLSFLNKCDILYDSVNHSKVYEYGISRNKLMDYMYSGKPILFSYDGYEDIISKIHNGFLVEPQNVEKLIKKILEINELDKNHLTEIGKKGKDFVLTKRQFVILANKYSEIL
tara:strand:- start:1097 stop:2167 length:1071 start_codon:yes stop_codon:yes gene_type:complete